MAEVCIRTLHQTWRTRGRIIVHSMAKLYFYLKVLCSTKPHGRGAGSTFSGGRGWWHEGQKGGRVWVARPRRTSSEGGRVWCRSPPTMPPPRAALRPLFFNPRAASPKFHFHLALSRNPRQSSRSSFFLDFCPRPHRGRRTRCRAPPDGHQRSRGICSAPLSGTHARE